MPILSSYIAHRREVILARSRFDKEKAEKRLHIVEGLIRVISILDEVIALIRASENKADAKENLKVSYEFTEEQAEAIVTLQLYRLTNTDVVVLQEEEAELREKIAFLVLRPQNHGNRPENFFIPNAAVGIHFVQHGGGVKPALQRDRKSVV